MPAPTDDARTMTAAHPLDDEEYRPDR
ncbi:MAG: hypothetical protein QOI42_736, partial [Frankiaceae bacterium]|nr:hypothetical protein [Frankiaceae bacterium]